MHRASLVLFRPCAVITATEPYRIHAMNSSMATAFEVGSGVNPGALKVTIQLIAMGVILLVFAWVIVQIFSAYQSNRATVADAVSSTLKAAVILCLLVTVVLW